MAGLTHKNAERLADVVAMVSFSYVTGMGIEVGIAGLTWSQSFFSRNASIPLNMLTARPFGVFRDWLIRRAGVDGRAGKAVVDLVAFVCFQIPIYLVVLTLSGAKPEQIAKAVSSVIGLFLFMGPPYGFWLDLCRRTIARWVDVGEDRVVGS